MIYGLLMENQVDSSDLFTSGIISFKRLNSGLMEVMMKEGSGAKKETWVPGAKDRIEFKEHLVELIQNIFDYSIDFEHNEKAKYCTYC